MITFVLNLTDFFNTNYMTTFMTTYQTTHLVFFSPTHTSAKVGRAIAEGMGMPRRIETDLTCDEGQEDIYISDSLTIVAAPVYGGLISETAMERIKRLKGHNAPVIVVAVYGNRDYEDALVQLRDTLAGNGFTPMAAGAFIGEHSYSRPAEGMPIAEGRPDASDLQKAEQFGKECLKKLEKAENNPSLTENLSNFFVKGNIPYKVLAHGTPTCPESTEDCCACGQCIDVCPTHAISLSEDGNQIITDINRCIRCCACVKECPIGARIYNTPYTAKLFQNFKERREPEIFL